MALSLKLADKPSDEEVMLTIPEHQLRKFLLSEKKSESEIERVMSTLKEQRHKIEKSAQKLYSKVITKYPNKSDSELFELVLRYATKYGLTSKAQQNAVFRVLIKKLKGIRESPYLPIEKPHTEMARFLGYRGDEPPLLEVSGDDKRYLEEVAAIYEKYCGYGKLHDLVKSTSKIADTNKTGYQLSTMKWNKDLDNKDVFIHPVIFLIYGYVNTDKLERLPIFASFARLILARSYNLMKSFFNVQYTTLFDLQVDNDLVECIAKDPSSTDFFSKQSPMANLVQRTRCQVALWENVLRLRNGQVYAKMMELNNPMTTLMMELERYPLTIFDDLNVYSFNNPVVILKKILAVFSYRSVMMKYDAPQNLFIQQALGMPAVSNAFQHQLLQPTYAVHSTIHIPYITNKDKDNNVIVVTISSLINQGELIIEKKSPVFKKRSLWDALDRTYVTINLFATETPMEFAFESEKKLEYKPLTPNDAEIKFDNITLGLPPNKTLSPYGFVGFVNENGIFNLCAGTNSSIYAPSLVKVGTDLVMSSRSNVIINPTTGTGKYVSIVEYQKV